MELRTKHLVWAASLLVITAISGCKKDAAISTDSLYVPTTADATANASLSDLQSGRSLYISHCGSCHGLYIPEAYSASQWSSILPGMTLRTSLSSSEVLLVKKYVTKGKL